MADVKTTTARPTSPQGGGKHAGKPKNTNNFAVNFIIVVAMVVLAICIFKFGLGAVGNFKDGEARHVPKNFMGRMYTGGFIVPILLSCLFILLTFVVERAITIFKARGKGNQAEFVRKVQYHLANKNVDAAIAECDKQSGSVGNVMRSGLVKYKEMINNSELDTDQKVLSIQKEIEEATALELPMLEKNLVFLSTLASVATLIGLLGTVLGMIRSFASMGEGGGGGDATALAEGISEALINTALGIGTSAIAIIAYNFYTTIIDGVTFGIDESGFTLTQSFAANYK